MSSFEVKVWGFKHNEPNPTRCTREICYLDNCQDVRVPCGKSDSKLYEVIIKFTVPDMDREYELIVSGCANEVAYIANRILVEAISPCLEFEETCLMDILNSLDLANEEMVETFHRCLRQSGMPEEMIHICEVDILVREGYI